jgi:hypothetical protein
MNDRFEPTAYVDAALLEEFFRGAPAGQKLMYAIGCTLDAAHPTIKLVNEWAATGEAVEFNQRRLGPWKEEYWFKRARPQMRDLGDGRGSKRVAVDDEWRETADGKIFLTLVRHANLGLPCPTNARLAEIAALTDNAGNPDADAARYRIKLLEKAGRIKLEHSGAGRSFRRVLITETGRWTADEPRSLALPGLMKGHAA